MADDQVAWRAGIKAGELVNCRVIRHVPFGFFVALDESREGIVERIQMERDGYKTPDEYPSVGSAIEGIVLGFRDWSQQVEVGLPTKLEQQEHHDRT